MCLSFPLCPYAYYSPIFDPIWMASTCMDYLRQGKENKTTRIMIQPMDHWLWTPCLSQKFQNAIFFKISKIPFLGLLEWV